MYYNILLHDVYIIPTRVLSYIIYIINKCLEVFYHTINHHLQFTITCY